MKRNQNVLGAFGILLLASGGGSAALAADPSSKDPLLTYKAPYDLNDYSNPPTLMGFSAGCYAKMAAACPSQAMSRDGKTPSADPVGGTRADQSISMNIGQGYPSDPNGEADVDKSKTVAGVYAYVPAAKSDGMGGASFEAKSYFCPFTQTKGKYNNESVYSFQIAGKPYMVSKDSHGHISSLNPNTDPDAPTVEGEKSSTDDYTRAKAASAPSTTCFELTDSHSSSPKRMMLEAERLMSPASIQSCLSENEEGIGNMIAYDKKAGTPDYQAKAAAERLREYNLVKNAFIDGCSSHYPHDRFPPNAQTGTLITEQSFAVLNRYKATKIDAPASDGSVPGSATGTVGNAKAQ